MPKEITMTYYLKKFWRINSLAAFLQVITYGIHVSLNLLMMQMFQGIIDRDIRYFLTWLGITGLGWTLYFLVRSLQTKVQYQAVMAMNNQYRHDVAHSLLHKSYGEFHAQDNGTYLAWMTNYTNKVESLAWEPFFQGVGLASQVVWAIIALASLHWSLLVASLFSFVILMVLPKLFEKKLEELGKKTADAQAAATGKLKDLLGGFDVLRFFGLSDRFLRQCDNASREMEQPACHQKTIASYVNSVMGFFIVATQLLVNVFIGILSIQGAILQAAIMGGGNLCGAVSNGLSNLAEIRLSFASAKPYFENVTHGGEEKAATAPQLEPLREHITLEHISFSYDERKPILNDQSFCFQKGGKYALTGPSGCGKSTILKLLLGWLPEYKGIIRFDGLDVREVTPQQLQSQMSYIEQNVFLFNTTIRDNITLGGQFTDQQLECAIKGSALDGDLKNMPLGLDTPVGEEGSNLSGGQKQRVAIARALIYDRSILLVDEGTSALDQKNADIVEQSLLNNPNLTLILVSHHLTSKRKAQFTKVFELEPVISTASYNSSTESKESGE